MTEKRGFSDIIYRFILFLWAVGILFPLVWIMYQSLRTNREFFQGVWGFPEVFRWENYAHAWTSYQIGQSLLNTLYYVSGSVILGTFITVINAYALTRLEFKGRKLLWSIIMFSLFLPGINVLIPQFILMRDLGLTNSLTGLIVLDTLGESVFFLLLLGGFMQSLPKELEESSFIDGATLFQTFYKIIFPLAIPGVVTVAIFKFLHAYNSFLIPLIYLSDQSKYTIGVNMYTANLIMQYKNDWVTLFAGVMITVVPSVVMFVLFQRRIMAGATMGAVKG